MKVILIKYGELNTKGDNRNFFINTLYDNIRNKLKDYNVDIVKDRAKMTIKFNDNDLDKIENIISKIFGIHSYTVAEICSDNLDDIKNTILKVANKLDYKTFKIESKRSNKNFKIHSMELNKILGATILKNNSNVSVDVHNPELLLRVEVRIDRVYVYYKVCAGSGGYPVGTQPKALLMLSGGIDSPVAGYMAMKRGVKIDAVYFEARPHTSLEAREKVISLCRKLSVYTTSINLHIVNFTPIQEEIYKNCRSDYCITIMRRMMYRIMEKLCKKYNGVAIVNGESIGQVASQTLTSMNVINSVTNMPVIRPLACFDKLEIMEIAREIETYEISILPYEDCCTVFVPRHPAINPKINIALNEESLFDYESLINKAIDEVNTIKIDSEDDREFDNLL